MKTVLSLILLVCAQSALAQPWNSPTNVMPPAPQLGFPPPHPYLPPVYSPRYQPHDPRLQMENAIRDEYIRRDEIIKLEKKDFSRAPQPACVMPADQMNKQINAAKKCYLSVDRNPVFVFAVCENAEPQGTFIRGLKVSLSHARGLQEMDPSARDTMLRFALQYAPGDCVSEVDPASTLSPPAEAH